MIIQTNDFVRIRHDASPFSNETAQVLTTYGSVGNPVSQVCLKSPIDGKRYWNVSDLEVVQ
jgi:hypothetical protein